MSEDRKTSLFTRVEKRTLLEDTFRHYPDSIIKNSIYEWKFLIETNPQWTTGWTEKYDFFHGWFYQYFLKQLNTSIKYNKWEK